MSHGSNIGSAVQSKIGGLISQTSTGGNAGDGLPTDPSAASPTGEGGYQPLSAEDGSGQMDPSSMPPDGQPQSAGGLDKLKSFGSNIMSMGKSAGESVVTATSGAVTQIKNVVGKKE